MFQRVLHTWGRLVGRKSDPIAVDEDRRIWVRYPCQVEATVQPAGGTDELRLSARVQNVSQGGISLVLDQRFEPGSLLSVDLPGPAGETLATVLAYVVHVADRRNGEWIIGCTFAMELTDEDLQAFGGKRLKPAGADQRNWVRFPCQGRAAYQVIRGAFSESSVTASAVLSNLAPNGVGLEVTSPVGVGNLLSLELRNRQETVVVTIMASVVRVTPHRAGRWVLGCNFIRELSEQEIQALI